MKHTSIIQTIMPCTYFLLFLLALLPLSSTFATTERYAGGRTTLDDRALAGRFCLRGPRSKFINHPPQSTENYVEKTPSIDAKFINHPPQSTEKYIEKTPSIDAKFINHPPQLTEKYIEKTPSIDETAQSSIDVAVQETVEPEKMSEDDEEGDPMSVKVAVHSKESMFEEKGSDDVKMSEKKTEEANKYKPPPKPKRSRFYDFEDIN